MTTPQPSRRSFLKTASTSAAALAASSSLGALHAATPVHQGPGKLKIGIVGIGGRGSGAAVQALMGEVLKVPDKEVTVSRINRLFKLLD